MRFNRVSKILQIIPRYHYYWFTAFRDWSRKFAASTNQNSKTETKRVFVNRVFPRFRQSAYFLCEFSLAPCGILLCCDWLLWVLCFGLRNSKIFHKELSSMSIGLASLHFGWLKNPAPFSELAKYKTNTNH